MTFALVYEIEGKYGYPMEKTLERKTLKGFEKALAKLMESNHIAIAYVSPNLVNNDMINALPTKLW